MTEAQKAQVQQIAREVVAVWALSKVQALAADPVDHCHECGAAYVWRYDADKCAACGADLLPF